MRFRPYVLLIFLIVLVDQVTKVAIKLNMYLGEEINLLGNWFKVYFAENNGFAFGMTFSDILYDWGIYLTPESGKFLLTILSLIAVLGLGWVMYKFSDHKSPMPIFIAFILGGAIGNIIDRVFYGLVFAPINTYEGGLFQGQVVDMFFFSFGESGHYSPIFNLADLSITLGIVVILIFQGKFIRKHELAVATPELLQKNH